MAAELGVRESARGDRVVKAGIVLAFTGRYTSVRLLARFLELAGIKLVKSLLTTPEILQAGTTLASADFCLPLRAFVGHVYHLLTENPDLTAIIAPNVLSEDGKSATCSKYRDLGGVLIRSLGDTVGYLLHHLDAGTRRRFQERLERLAGTEIIRSCMERAAGLPTVIMPSIRSLDWVEMRNLCFRLYADLMGWKRVRRAALLLPEGVRRISDGIRRVEEAFCRAWAEVVEQRKAGFERLLADAHKPRLALVGRSYLIDDPLLTAGLKRWFERRGVAVFTARDLPAELLAPGLRAAEGFYDTYKEARAFVEWALDKVDGFICAGSFGCHPDAFQVDYLAEYIRARGVPCWIFRFDEAAGSAGFQTRFETILTFLQECRDRRLRAGTILSRPAGVGEAGAAAQSLSKSSGDLRRRPLIIWPYMGEILNLLVEELGYQTGLEQYMVSPPPLDEEAMLLGNDRYTESCSPYACSTGSLKLTLRRVLDALDAEAAAARREGRDGEPRRILILMARGEGPCTFGWYAIVQNKHLPQEFAERLAAGGHTLEMATMGLSGVVDFVRELCQLGDSRRLRPILEYLEATQPEESSTAGRNPAPAWPLHRWRRSWLRLRFYLNAGRIALPLWVKLRAAEGLRARAMILRAHELHVGDVSRAYRQALEILRQAHSLRAMVAAYRRGMQLLASVPRDDRPRPRVVAVGEIYVALTSFANRGTLENLLGRAGIEVVEGTTLSGFLVNSLREMLRRSLRRSWPARPLAEWLRRHGIYIGRLEQQIRDRMAMPFMVHEVGGEGLPTVGHARRHVEAGCDGIVHVQPLKCMPESIAKDAVKELAALYNVLYLSLSFDKETDIERLKTEVATFAALLHARVEQEGAGDLTRYRKVRRQEVARRRRLGCLISKLWRTYCSRGVGV
ncbi:MAG: hypothetical protein IMX00_08645 [Limnochordales bacterium]|nr:hypothetical protein [Limnochordales bacterium]